MSFVLQSKITLDFFLRNAIVAFFEELYAHPNRLNLEESYEREQAAMDIEVHCRSKKLTHE
jgi:hypothetical protein